MAVPHNGLMPRELGIVIAIEQQDQRDLLEGGARRAMLAAARDAERQERREAAKGVCRRCNMRRALNRHCFC